ncbi:MAG: putative bifunctional diguanylate cyclase/phosphodiesterase [Paracoccaceae bacterium]
MGNALMGPQTLAFLPAVTLAGYWFGGEGFLIFLALLLPAVFALGGMFSGTGPAWADARDGETELRLRGSAERALGQILANEQATGKTTAAIAVSLDDFVSVERQFGRKAATMILKQAGERLTYALRETDAIVRLSGPRFAVALGPIRRADLETLIQLSARLQSAIAEPFSLDATRIYVTASVGFCLPGRAPDRSGTALLECAEDALETAISHGAGSIRAYSAETKRRAADRLALHSEIAGAMDTGQVRAWFQPQISTHTGEITGFEALARWEHPERGTILPMDFVPALAGLGLQARLCEIILGQSLLALRDWDRAGHTVPGVSVNFSGDELSNPKLSEKVRWELDRFDIAPARLCVEILEDVIAASEEDVIVRNILALSELGCSIDLDDFGTGHASIASIRRFAVDRIKIDRSFITRVDRDRDQQNMVAAILTMAERLEIDTLAEGVETIGEHAILAQLGCGHVQGFSVARPMPPEATLDWITRHNQKLSTAPLLGKKAV